MWHRNSNMHRNSEEGVLESKQSMEMGNVH